MLEKIYIWIYCLEIHEILILLALFTGLLYDARRWWHHRRFWKPALLGLLLLWCAAVIAQTVFMRTSHDSPQALWQPLQSYAAALAEGGQPELLRSNFMNAVLFFPGGLLLALLLPSEWKSGVKILAAGMVFAAMSTCIELYQYYGCLGIGQTDDIIHNVLGALCGAAAILLLPIMFNRLRTAFT